MSGADRLEDGFPHGTVDGYLQGCKGGWCPEGNAHGLSCKRAKQLNSGDYRYQRLVKTGHTPAQIADELGLAPETHPTPTPAPKPEPVQEEPVMAFETFTKPEPTQKPQPHGYAAVRAWARENGIHVNAQGRVPRAVMDAYDAVHAQEPADAPEPVAAPVEPQEPETPAHEAVEAGDRVEERWQSMTEVITERDTARTALELTLQKWGQARADLADARRLIHALSNEVVARRRETAEAQSQLATIQITSRPGTNPVETAKEVSKAIRWFGGNG